ncbi:TetR/AcrR family transcriptional regulator [Amycolatopsis samaneae]|uniref:TetR/AcrR family transcriptional regulator n=1 Tax=Amycolatopsis samaneae TaxID=664691 RepID=A0ABW5GFP8_9PSEU
MAPHPESTPSRRERPAKPALTRAGIVAAAVGLMSTEGLAKVTMRRLAQELDTGPASLYVYVRNTAELHAAILDELLGTVDLSPAGTTGDWRDRLVRVLTSYTAVLFEHRGLAPSALVARPSGEHYLALVEAVLALLDEGGVPADQAAWAVDLLLQFATATAAEHAPHDRAPGAEKADMTTLATVLRTVPAATHPRIAELGEDLLSGPGEARLDWGFRVLLNGIPRTPRPA